MGRAPKPGKCVHCLQYQPVLTWDHVFPKSWYPAGATGGLYKWQIPACKECNAAYGALEDDLLVRLGLCIDPRISAASGILEKAQRAIDPTAAVTKRDRMARSARRAKIVAERLVGNQIPTVGIYPGFHQRWAQPESDRAALAIPKASFEKLTTKVVRGIFWQRDRRYIGPPYRIAFYVLDPNNEISEMTQMLRQGEVFAHEPGIKVTRAVVPDDGLTSLFEIEIWGTFKMHAFVGREDAQSVSA